jgi:hypothetical protein
MPRGRKPEQTLDPTLSDGVIAVVLLILSLIVGLSFFGKAGVVGTVLNEYVLSFLFGDLRFITPLILVSGAWYCIREKKEEEGGRAFRIFGYLLFFVSIASLFHMQFSPDDMWNQAVLGNGGGMSGMLAHPASAYLGILASYIILTGIALISLFLHLRTRTCPVYLCFSQTIFIHWKRGEWCFRSYPFK